MKVSGNVDIGPRNKWWRDRWILPMCWIPEGLKASKDHCPSWKTRDNKLLFFFVVGFFSLPFSVLLCAFWKGDKNKPSAGLGTCGICTNRRFRPTLETRQTKLSSLGTWQLHYPAPEWLPRGQRVRLQAWLSPRLDKLFPTDTKRQIWESECHPSCSLTALLGSQGCQWAQVRLSVLCLSSPVVASLLYTERIRCHQGTKIRFGCYYGQLWHNTNIIDLWPLVVKCYLTGNVFGGRAFLLWLLWIIEPFDLKCFRHTHMRQLKTSHSVRV